MVEHLHDGADADGDEKGDDQHRHRAAQQRLGRQQPPIRRLGDRLREAFDRIRTRRRTRHIGARHERPPFGMSPTTLVRKDVPHPFRITRDWNRWALICRESQSQLFKNRYPPDCLVTAGMPEAAVRARPARVRRYRRGRATEGRGLDPLQRGFRLRAAADFQVRQVRKAVASRAAICGFFGSSASTVSAMKA